MAETTSFARNRYWVLRHGKSIPNEKGLIVSSMENGTRPEYQLAPEGVDQAKLAGELFRKVLEENSMPIENVRICYSPFSRTRQTAEVVASVLNIQFEDAQCKVMENLRERFFGPSYELMSHDKYHEVWAIDEKDPLMKPEGGESVDDVASRLVEAIANIESQFQGCTILVVSHGDTLQILQTILNAAKPDAASTYDDLTSRMQTVRTPSILSEHRKFSLLTAELRAVI
ncbi:uncharacterized protein LOC133735390 [Rosa rugosa]|uniref:uncharacterized protein LOC133735390 n=1 Tax=Rosa rugosa TaxID=74645 RepID=UPI002B404382|nr:uncharacterized protein LOC133735390 [Rosa rugosa]XP_062018785.1 uncharacterized protein LOC133735390 [Rosa rugosa]XP_062018786.1 uncharacterized protein LOC133735390 [Rosa rugosa]